MTCKVSYRPALLYSLIRVFNTLNFVDLKLVGWGLTALLRQQLSLYWTLSQREGEKKRIRDKR